jgi:hypothetical protein
MSILTDYRIGGVPRLYLGDPKRVLMLIDDNIRKCVQFLQYQSGTGMALAGTTFLVHFRRDDGEDFGYLITAKHVIEAIRNNSVDGQVYVRVNTIDGSVEEVGTNARDWLFHPTDPTTDVAALPLAWRRTT